MILGQVLTAAQGQNPARQASMAAGIPKEVPAWGVNQVCGSGLRAVALAAQAIQTGDSAVVVAGGQENMSLSTHAQHIRAGTKMGGLELVDTMIKDGLTDVFNGYHMGITAENLAEQYQVTRDDQDAFAAASQQKASKARSEGRFREEIAGVTVKSRKGETVVDTDEYPRAGVTAEALKGLRPAFAKDGTVTAGNASGLNDAGAALVLMEGKAAQKAGARPMARLVAYAHAGVEPQLMGLGPIPAVRRVFEKAGLKPADMDIVESNEAFAVQAMAVTRDLGLDPAKVNPNGGAVALGHPIGATGSILTVKALYELERTQKRYALVTMCIGGGQGISVVLESMH